MFKKHLVLSRCKPSPLGAECHSEPLWSLAKFTLFLTISDIFDYFHFFLRNVSKFWKFRSSVIFRVLATVENLKCTFLTDFLPRANRNLNEHIKGVQKHNLCVKSEKYCFFVLKVKITREQIRYFLIGMFNTTGPDEAKLNIIKILILKEF